MQSAQRTAIVGVAFFAPLFWRSKKAGRLPGRDPACPHGSKAVSFHQSANVAIWPCAVRTLHSARRLRSCVQWADEASRLSCRTTRPGLGPAADLLLLSSPREVGKRRRPYDGGPLRGLHTPLVPKSGSVRNSLALRQRTLLYPISAPATCRHLTGIHCNFNFNFNFNCNFNCNFTSNCNGRCAGLSATSTATVAARECFITSALGCHVLRLLPVTVVCSLPQVYQRLQYLVLRLDRLRIGLVYPLRGNHVDQFCGQVHVRIFYCR